MIAPDIVALGEPLFEFSQLPGHDGRHYLQGFGGDTSNCAIAAARMGARVAYATRLGDDDFGRQFLALWKTEGIDTSGVGIDPEAHTGVYFIAHGPGGHVFSYLRKGSAASRMRPAHLPRGLIERARFFYASGISQAISADARATVSAAIGMAKRAGAQVFYDANFRPRLWAIDAAREAVRATLPATDCFLLSAEDGAALAEAKEPEAILAWCHAAGAATVALKLGSDGVVLSDSRGVVKVPGHKVESVDATGAGDCFSGALMARMAGGDTLREALYWANAAAALATTGYGAVAPLPHLTEVKSILS